MKVRVTEQVATVVENFYDVEIPNGVPNSQADDDIEDYLDRERDQVHTEVIRKHVEILGVEELDTAPRGRR